MDYRLQYLLPDNANLATLSAPTAKQTHTHTNTHTAVLAEVPSSLGIMMLVLDANFCSDMHLANSSNPSASRNLMMYIKTQHHNEQLYDHIVIIDIVIIVIITAMMVINIMVRIERSPYSVLRQQ